MNESQKLLSLKKKKNQGPGYGQDGNTYITFENMQNKATYYL